MMRRAYIFVLTMVMAGKISAIDLTDKQMEHADGTRSIFSELYANPALQSGRYANSLNRIGISYLGDFSTIPVRLEYGSRRNLAEGRIDAYLNKGKTTLWGHARYDNGRIKNIQFNETTDFDLLNPYVIADTVGGNSNIEIYDFLGGFAYNLGKWVIGGEGQYQAELDYRTRDPRPKNLTSDLRLKVGSSYRIHDYLTALSLSFRRYKQTNEVKIYSEVSAPIFYHMTGLNTDYYRFRGENTNIYYKGIGGGGSLEIKPVQESGWVGSVGYQYLSLEKIVSTLNQLPMNEKKLHQQHATVGYLHHIRRHAIAVKLLEQYQETQGIENIFGSAADNIYPQIGSESQYKNKQLNLSAEFFYQYRPEKALYEVTYQQGYQNIKETYVEPARLMKSSATVSMLSLKGLWQMRQWLLQADARLRYEWSASNDLQLSGTLNEKLLPALYNYYDYLRQNRYQTTIGVELSYDTGKKFALFVAPRWQYSHYIQHEHQQSVNITAGVKF